MANDNVLSTCQIKVVVIVIVVVTIVVNSAKKGYVMNHQGNSHVGQFSYYPLTVVRLLSCFFFSELSFLTGLGFCEVKVRTW